DAARRLAGDPVAMAAGEAALQQRDAALYARLEATAAELEAGSREARPEARIARVGSLLTAFVLDFASFFNRLRAGGVLVPPSQYEAWFVSAAHDPTAVELTIAAARGT